ncbi:MAG: trypsin-like peptidase domain-containing protein [Tannerellaceae bacterium]|nr:trypsin-like peptidase domain-containing protein [Tannerellaceae bacterium]
MKRNTLIILFSLLLSHAYGQVSHGGKPLPFAVQTRSASKELFEEMPAFDLNRELERDMEDSDGLRGSYRFAYKFMADFDRTNSGISYTLPDGTTVWRLGIRSKGALSINLIFSEYELPEGAQLFIYDPEQRQILGAFNHLNNSKLRILPVAPIGGDELIVEYQEPLNVSFRGRLTIGEINHAYRALKGIEPGGDKSSFHCMPSPICYADSIDDGLEKASRSAVLLTINGTTACTGVLVNNTAEDGKPYLMTASHCLNENFKITNPDYEAISGSVVCFFNYNSPTCDTVRRGTEEMSVASAFFRAVNTDYDMALMELLEIPPAYYRPYYAGWSIDAKGGMSPYRAFHHPLASVKRLNIVDDAITLKSYPGLFIPNSHWNVEHYSVGCTDGGSSGAPLFDASNRVVGLLSGGRSVCDNPRDDFYYALLRAWVHTSGDPQKQLKTWLDPGNGNAMSIDGLDPYSTNPCTRLSNVFESKLNDSIETAYLPNSAGKMFGVNSLNSIAEYAEEYYASAAATVEGIYLVAPSVADNPNNLKVEITVYSSLAGKPHTLLHAEPFSPTYCELVKDSFVTTPKSLQRAQESFVRLSKTINVNGTFFVGYRISAPASSSFSVYNLRKGLTLKNTAWINRTEGWTTADCYPTVPFKTALFIDPVIRYRRNVANEPSAQKATAGIFVDVARTHLHITIYEKPVAQASFNLYAADGRLIMRQIVEIPARILVKSCPPGIYIATLQWGNEFYSQKIIL